MPETFRADLHMHSQCSDGHWHYTQLIQEALNRNIQAISITDHDTLEAYPAALVYAQQHKLLMIPGIELTTHFQDISVHVLGYSFDLNAQALTEPLKALNQARHDRIQTIIERLHKRQVDIHFEELTQSFGHGLLARPHIAQLLVKKGYAKSIESAFNNYLSDRHMGSLKLKALTCEEAIDLIHQANGFAVLAHPQLIKQRKKLKALLSLGFDGLEAFYSTYHEKSDWMCQQAQEYGLFVTGGSDFHYPKTYQPLGCSFTSQEIFEKLHHRSLENNPLIG